MANETVAAISTPPGRGGIGVIRISGASLAGMLQALVDREVKPRHATRADFRDSQGVLIDQGLVLYFPQPQSYTGEDVIELQAHGGAMVLQLLLQRCVELGARLAEPGEFTKRAFLSGKLDLAQAEGVADLIDASTAAAARCAVRSLQGEFSLRIEALVQSLIDLRMLVEATLDFPEENIELLEHYDVLTKFDRIREQVVAVLAGARQGSILRAGVHAVIAGHPNVGKSSLLNRLAGEEVAIVTEIPGTTRDAIRQSVSIEGVPVHVVDTAGLRESTDPVETIGISRSWGVIAGADLVLWVADATRPETAAVSPGLPPGIPVLHIQNKTDLLPLVIAQDGYIPLSAQTGQGMQELKQAILAVVGWGSAGEGVYMARERHLQALRAAHMSLQRAPDFRFPELLAEDLKLAQRELSTIAGEFTADDLLGQIFARFCIGK